MFPKHTNATEIVFFWLVMRYEYGVISNDGNTRLEERSYMIIEILLLLILIFLIH